MSAADDIFIKNMNDILNNGTWDTDYPVRPHWADGTPAHTVKKFCIVNRYDLSKELPILTIRRTYFKSCLDELLWIWQKKSNNIHDLHSHVWDSWADETGSIGKAYGYQLAKKAIYPEGEFDQVDRVLYDLKHNPHSRRIMTNLYNFEDLHEMHLYPCAYSMTFNVTGDTLNGILNQRSNDMLAANNTTLRMWMAQALRSVPKLLQLPADWTKLPIPSIWVTSQTPPTISRDGFPWMDKVILLGIPTMLKQKRLMVKRSIIIQMEKY